MKKLLLPAMIAVILIQLFVPVYMVINKYIVLKTGEEFKFRVSPVDPYDAFRGRYVSLYSEQNPGGSGKYGLIMVDTDSFAKIVSLSDKKPLNSPYVKSNTRKWFSMPIDRYYMDEKFAPKAESLTRQRKPGEETYVTVRVKNGALVISGLYIDGTAIEDIIRAGSF